ncbi:MAG: hypothetical protein CMG75_10770 [Candidatus Marinimicrobia bacterium]|nr:hypothetical protein [Candidatus Neomarinimicrobiota bacterium]|tara:strand:- start:282 stop:584 length:303 start_codon:yes stop_codon:yes gene_type:complete
MPKYPSLSKQSRNVIRSLKFGIYRQGTRAISIFDSDAREQLRAISTDETYNKRIAICVECDKYDEGDHRCLECGCYLNAKARFGHESCPIGKWGPGEFKD